MGKPKMLSHWSAVPNCCGVGLRSGTLWLAEICALIGIGLILLSVVSIESINYYLGRSFDYYWRDFYYIPLGFGLFQSTTSLLLAYGVVVEKPLYFIPWLVFFTLQTALIFLGSVGVAIRLSTYIIPMPFNYFTFIIGVAYSGLFRHFILVVYSYYKELRTCSTDLPTHVINLA